MHNKYGQTKFSRPLANALSVVLLTAGLLFTTVGCGDGETNDDASASSQTHDGSTGGGGESQSTDTMRALSADDKKAMEFVKTEFAKHFVQTPNGWTTQHQAVNFFGQLVENEDPNNLFTQWRKAEFVGVRSREPSEADKLNGIEYIADVDIEVIATRSFERLANFGQRTWSAWGEPMAGKTISRTVLRVKGNWQFNADSGFKGIKPTKPIPD